MPVLITAACHAEAYQIERLLQAEDVVFADHQNLPAFSSHKFIKISKGNSQSFAHEILTLCLDHQITQIFPLYKDEISTLSESKLLFEEFGISIIVPSVSWLKSYTHKPNDKPINVVIFEKGEVIAGNLPGKFNLPEEKATGIFTWNEYNHSISYNLYSITDDYV
ncbi:MAG: hypothetical protein WBP45_03550 [Daejeonella sp.]